MGLGDFYGPKPWEFLGFGGIHGPKPSEFIGFDDENTLTQPSRIHTQSKFGIGDVLRGPDGPAFARHAATTGPKDGDFQLELHLQR